MKLFRQNRIVSQLVDEFSNSCTMERDTSLPCDTRACHYSLRSDGRGWEDNIKLHFKQTRVGERGIYKAGSGYGPVTGCCECDYELSVSTNCWKFLDQPINYRFSKKPWCIG